MSFPRVLIMGLPGSGKTTLALEVVKKTGAIWLNADAIRAQNHDWDFSLKGRLRQAVRMNDLAQNVARTNPCIIDFVCPNRHTQEVMDYERLVFMDTIQHGRYSDTYEIFMPPQHADLVVERKNAEEYLDKIIPWLSLGHKTDS